MSDAEQCAETIYVRDTYRRTGRTPSGFEMHYNQQRCSRRAVRDGKCWQHGKNYTWERRWARGKWRMVKVRKTA